MKLNLVANALSLGLLLMGTSSALAENTILGTNAGVALTSGDLNTMLGAEAGKSQTTSSNSTFVGVQAGSANVTGVDNTFIGTQAGAANTTNSNSTFIGARAGLNSTGYNNTFVGSQAGVNNTIGNKNTFIGKFAGKENIDGHYNTHVGEEAGKYGATGRGNTSLGMQALWSNIGAHYNTALGHKAGFDMGKPMASTGEPYNGSRNTAVGNSSGHDIGGGTANTMLGDNAGPNTESGDFNTFVGFQAGFDNNRTSHLNDSNRNTALGAYAGFTNREGEDNVWIGTLADSADWAFNNDGEVSNLQTSVSDWVPSYYASTRTNANMTISRTTVLGNSATVLADDGIALGYSSRVAGVGSIAIGTNAATAHANSVTIGYGASSKADNTVVIGNDTTVALTANIDAVTALGTSTYRFKDVFSNKVSVNAATGAAAKIDLWADAGAANDDKWSLSAANGGNFTISSEATGSQVALVSVTNAGDMTVSGDLAINSDRRLKTNITTIQNASDLIGQLEGKRYNWKPQLQRDDRLHLGLIAQEVEAVLPELVIENKDGIKSVNYVGVIPVLINALNQQKAQIEKQQQQIDLLLSLLNK